MRASASTRQFHSEQLISQYAVQLTQLVNDVRSEATEGERRAAALLAVAQSGIDERERQIDHLKSELALLREERAAFKTLVRTQLEERELPAWTYRAPRCRIVAELRNVRNGRQKSRSSQPDPPR